MKRKPKTDRQKKYIGGSFLKPGHKPLRILRCESHGLTFYSLQDLNAHQVKEHGVRMWQGRITPQPTR